MTSGNVYDWRQMGREGDFLSADSYQRVHEKCVL